ncbi:sensor histidine kinase [Goodfellowiella coeruleoviolacea]|uniref:histidine kinase n=1 Tax=Goodfellowiella coeruleoviolacea TaxID=334858 RepID=A0AAE3KJ57_9PSEU|nr:sensor histidine kinase [Goodfellowiella coeruleoviolacea]MCP2169235.1 Signal transduction histidine kinase [Goodfellowiella coeruleoviolacea]
MAERAPRVSRLAAPGWSFVFILFSLPVSVPLLVGTVLGTVLSPLWLGLPVLVLFAALVRGYTDTYRRWAGRVLGVAIPRPYRPIPRGGPFTKLKALGTDPATYRDHAWLWLNATLGFAMSVISLALFLGIGFYLIEPYLMQITPPDVFSYDFGLFRVNAHENWWVSWVFAVLAFVLWWILGPVLLRGYARLARWLLGPSARAQLSQRVADLASSRAETVDIQAAELRRIERDLHDGAQARLVSLGMSLGMAEDLLTRNPGMAQELLAEARQSTSLALSELRGLVRGIHPPVLADRGLDGAVQALALANPLSVDVDIDLPVRLPAPVESAAYFAIAEVLTNAAKHSGAGNAWVRVRYEDGQLGMMVGDNGRGGATAAPGGGLHGIERRLSAFDGTVTVASPVGGPTVVTMRLRCDPATDAARPS